MQIVCKRKPKNFKNMKANPIIYLDTRRSKATGKYPVKLRITFGKEQKYYSIGIDLSKEDFHLIQNPASMKKGMESAYKKRLKEWRIKCHAILIKANAFIETMPEFTFTLFERKYFQNKQSSNDVYEAYAEAISNKIRNGRIGTASNYQSSMNSLKQFSPKLKFRDITAEFLKEYETWLMNAGKSQSTVGIYLRPLRAIINTAISEGLVTRETHYQFGKGKYQIPSSRNVKKALTKEEIKALMSYSKFPGTWLEKAKDFFILSYLCNGINIKDIALLKFRNIDGDYIYFTRAKTQHTNRTSSTSISIFITPEVQDIIDKWKNSDTDPDDYLFPILEPNITPQREQRLIQQFTKMINKYIKQVALSLDITKPITTYYARHSFATILRRSGAPTEFIGESLGHTSTKTTASYLDSFENEAKKNWLKTLID